MRKKQDLGLRELARGAKAAARLDGVLMCTFVLGQIKMPQSVKRLTK